MTIRELEDIDTGLKILSYECDDFLNENSINLQSFFNLYFLYCGLVGRLRNMQGHGEEVRTILRKFPMLIQPAFLIVLPAFAYISCCLFWDSIINLLLFVLAMGLLFYLGYRWLQKKLRTDLLKVVQLCSTLRLHLNKIKMKKIEELLD